MSGRVRLEFVYPIQHRRENQAEKIRENPSLIKSRENQSLSLCKST
jgi:hypothetical protein